MSTLLVRGGIDVHGDPIDVVIRDGVIVSATAPADSTASTAPADAPVLDAAGLTLAPGLIDLQVNGAGGVDITAEPERLWDVAAVLPRFGVTAFVPTVITSAPEARERALATLAAGPRTEGGRLGAVPLGLHFEGPMISPARKGAHPPQWLVEPSTELIEHWSRDAGVLMVTIAPELPGALDLIRSLAARGVVVSVGHTQASAATVEAAIAAGARMMTHLGNAMPPLLGRDPGPVGVALGGLDGEYGGLAAGVIADGHHLDALTVNAAWRALGPSSGRSRFIAVTDTTAALGIPDGPSRLGDQDVIVADGTVRLADGTLAGSAASLPQCLQFLRTATGCTLAEAVGSCTSAAASLIADPTRGTLEVGARGDLTLLDTDTTALGVAATIVGGRIAYQEGI